MQEKNVFDIFRKDHEQFISGFYSGIKLLSTTKNIKMASCLWQYCNLFLENYHHEAEEVTLFKKVAENPKIKNGGPQCTYFYDVQMANNPLLRVYRELGISDHSIRADHIPQKFKEEFNAKLPIVIPLEEHVAGKLLLAEINKLIGKNYELGRIIYLFKLYLEIQVFHFKKEESCFFLMCESLLSNEDLMIAMQTASAERAKIQNKILPFQYVLALKAEM